MAVGGVGFDSKETVQAFIDKIKSQRGELVPSVSYYQKGYLNSSNLVDGFKDVTILNIEHQRVQYRVTFSTPMPDADYVVVVDVHNTNLQVEVASDDKTVNGFVVTVRNLVATMRADRGETTDGFTFVLSDDYFNWQAFKLMTDESRALDEQAIASLQAVVPSGASASNKLVTESEISKTEKTLAVGGSASAIVKIDVSVPFLDSDYGKFTEIDFQVRSDNIRFFISANDGAYLVTAQPNYRSSGWLTGLNYLVNGSKNISLYVSILNYPANVGAKLVFNGLDGAEITGMSKVSALPSGYAPMKQYPVIYTSDLTSTVTSGSSAPITSGGVATVKETADAASLDATLARGEIGDITALETTTQDDLVSAINELVHRINAL